MEHNDAIAAYPNYYVLYSTEPPREMSLHTYLTLIGCIRSTRFVIMPGSTHNATSMLPTSRRGGVLNVSDHIVVLG